MSVRWLGVGFLAMAAMLFLLAAAGPARGQDSSSEMDLGRLYRRARVRAQAARLLRYRRARVAPAAPVLLRTARSDSVRAWLRRRLHSERTAPPAEPAPTLAFPIERRRAFGRLERPLFKNRFHDVRWAFLGANGRAARLDTMKTRELRARLQARFGDPTRTAVDADSLAGRPASDYIQFEYWLTANDSIPVKVMDTGGPFDRGLVFAAPRRYRERLRALRKAVLAPLLRAEERARYVDYYFDIETEAWYRAGFDGRRFFVKPADPDAVMPGRRPVLREENERREGS